MKRKSCTVVRSHQVESVPQVRHLPLVDLLVDTRTELLELAIRSGMKVFATMWEEDRIAICGPRYAHEPEREASRAGRVASAVVLGGRTVSVQRPRVRAHGHEVALPTFPTMAATDPLHRRAVEQMLIGVATRQYARSLEAAPAGVTTRSTSKSAVSRRSCRADGRAARCLAIEPTRGARPGGVVDRRRARRRALHRGGLGHRCHGW